MTSTHHLPNSNVYANKHVTIVTCHECDNKVALPFLSNRQTATCPRCGFVLTRFNQHSVQSIIAFSIAALIFLGLSLPFNFLGFSANGQEQSIGIISGIQVLIEEGDIVLAILQMLSIVVIPAMVLIGILLVVCPLQLGLSWPFSKRILTLVFSIIPWSMAEIFLIGVLVSLVKVSSLADISLGMSFYAYIGFTLCLIAAILYMDKHQLYLAVAKRPHQPAKLHKSESLQRTWALLCTSILFYIPANTLPIMHTYLLGTDEPSTILGGVILLWQSGSYPIAIVIFIASVIVPVGKLLILIWLNYTVQKGKDSRHSERIFWYRVTEFIGRWSMIDIFVVAILVSLIQLGNTMSVYPGPAALAFCGVVVLTMLAAMTFDTRLIWTNSVNNNEQR
ncbi:paraquat-inducible protein A [Aliiglaciecola sp. LCG003]|uniref:paraquat-inducible protein A n=1 Tax=Aliiglaciecola sp. LCG003 TaxID=3053655 RepID=UPI002573F85C|nr:paraquat-inducible protein A [Aliiglaciecola sp. LCG003]WJG08062.1 paraquat-inducible protein A [Aliiglaciecola sp. LCG003]